MIAAPAHHEPLAPGATVVVTGASGFLGTHVVRRLVEHGFAVRALARHPAGNDPDRWRLPSPDAPTAEFRDNLRGATHVVHCAALNTDMEVATEADLTASNAVLPARLAEACGGEGVQRFVFLSSTRAVAGATASARIDETTPPQPECAYGRSKLAGERAVLATLSGSGSTLPLILRLPVAYGKGMRGNLAMLMRLARMPLPLPLAAIPGRRSLVAADSVADAVLTLLVAESPAGRVYVASDASAVSVPDIVRAFRNGFGRNSWLFPIPGPVLAAAVGLLGKSPLWYSLSATQICDPAALMKEGWTPCADSRPGLAAAAAAFRAARSPG